MSPTKSTQLVDIDNTRLPEQHAVMTEIVAAGECPFCLENLAKYHHQPTLLEGKHWLVTTNQWPYKHTRHQFMIISKAHLTHISEVTTEMGGELFELLRQVADRYDLPGGGLSLRFGDTQFSAGTVAHLHAQLIVPEITDPDFEPVRVKLGKNRK